MRGGCNGQQIRDHGLVESGQPVIDEPGPLWRPVPQQRVIYWSAAVPIPLYSFPKVGNSLIDTLPGFTVALEVLPIPLYSFPKVGNSLIDTLPGFTVALEVL